MYPYINIKIPVKLDILGEKLLSVVDEIISHLSVDVQNQLESGVCDWEGTALLENSIVDNLVQLDVIKKKPLDGWVCEELGCNLKKNLWFNLTDGVNYFFLN